MAGTYVSPTGAGLQSLAEMLQQFLLMQQGGTEKAKDREERAKEFAAQQEAERQRIELERQRVATAETNAATQRKRDEFLTQAEQAREVREASSAPLQQQILANQAATTSPSYLEKTMKEKYGFELSNVMAEIRGRAGVEKQTTIDQDFKTLATLQDAVTKASASGTPEEQSVAEAALAAYTTHLKAKYPKDFQSSGIGGSVPAPGDLPSPNIPNASQFSQSSLPPIPPPEAPSVIGAGANDIKNLIKKWLAGYKG